MLLVLVLITGDMLDASTHLDGFMQLWLVNRQSDNTHWVAVPERLTMYAMVLVFGNIAVPEILGRVRDGILFGNTHWTAVPEYFLAVFLPKGIFVRNRDR